MRSSVSIKQEFAKYCQQQSDPIVAHRSFADLLYQRGDYLSAVNYYLGLLNLHLQQKRKVSLQDYNHVIANFYALGDYHSAIKIFEAALPLYGNHHAFLANYGLVLYRVGELESAEKTLQQVLVGHSDFLPALDCLAAIAGRLGNHDQALQYGLRSLDLKDRHACSEKNLKQLTQWIGPSYQLNTDPVIFDPTKPQENIIAFSLWGSLERYTKTAIRNAQLALAIYPHWTCRFYCDDTVPVKVINELLLAHAEIVMRPARQHGYDGLLWRFDVMSDPNIKFFIIRDCDSLLNCQERTAVDEWLISQKLFHVMRNGYTHSELILAGLWGGVANRLPKIQLMLNQFLRQADPERTIDQRFLRHCVWPFVKKSVLVHDDIYHFGGRHQYPRYGRFQTSQFHVGQNISAMTEKFYRRANPLIRTTKPPETYVYIISPFGCYQDYLAEVCQLNIKQAMVYAERDSCGDIGLHTPDASHFKIFNSLGNVSDIQAFWRLKFLSDSFCCYPCLIETSHVLAKSGLLENIHMLTKRGANVKIIVLQQKLIQEAWNFLNFSNIFENSLSSHFLLNINDKNCIMDGEALRKYGVLGGILWNIIETRARANFYKQLFVSEDNIHFYDYDCHELDKEDAIRKLVQFIYPQVKINSINSPTIVEPQRQFNFDQSLEAQLAKLIGNETALIEKIDSVSTRFFKQGRRLADPLKQS